VKIDASAARSWLRLVAWAAGARSAPKYRLRLMTLTAGGPRQPGARGGVFHQKISNSERILLALLYHRRLCTLEVLADALGDVSRTAIGNVIRETLPLLQQEDRIPGATPTWYRTAADLLAAGAASDTATS
jgi:hypothetical protein